MTFGKFGSERPKKKSKGVKYSNNVYEFSKISNESKHQSKELKQNDSPGAGFEPALTLRSESDNHSM
ncbi:hypothetical protein CDAR_508141 [Caerostris darwini]|uniref:Uncharacterized protein n=1 Tax=Caerostris darwini TaxID=1538125 RepID=A0AAV4WSC9_9ARAC|nr:hypothetical protein CDAR_508141 [Caerostris darwini]